MLALESRLSLWGPITRSGSDLHSSLFSSFGVYLLNNTYVHYFMVCLVFSSIYTTLLEKCLTLHWPRSWCIIILPASFGCRGSIIPIMTYLLEKGNGIMASIRQSMERRCCTQIGTPKYMKRFSNAFEVWSHVVDHRKMSLIINGQVPPWCHYLYQACQDMKMKGKSSFFVYLFLIYDITVLVLAIYGHFFRT